MGKRGRPCLYDELIKPRLEDIAEWSKNGCTNKEIAAALGIHQSTFSEYLNKYTELKDAVRKSRLVGVPDVKNALYKRACGFEYEEKKIYIKRDEDGKEYKYTEINKKQALPDVAAIGMYLRNYSDDFSDNDKLTNAFKEMELNIRKELAESKTW